MVGPSGSGKTSSIYAVAEELGLEVLEINATSKRTGKEIVEMFGESTQSHTVLQDYSAVEMRNEQLNAEKRRKRRKDRRKDVKEDASGGKARRSGGTSKPKEVDPVVISPLEKPVLTKVSLILCEEVDILFEEDRGFWAGLNTLAKLSKRPIVMTCNGEFFFLLYCHLFLLL